MSYGQIVINRAPLIIYGAGGMARELAWLAESCSDVGALVAFLDDDANEHGRTVNGVPVMSLAEAVDRFPDAWVVGGVGQPALRERLVQRALEAGLRAATLVHPHVERSRWSEIGEGTVICAGSNIAPNVVLGRHVQINRSCDVSHDVMMGDYATLAPGVKVSGRVRIGARAYIGTNACIINGEVDAPLVIGDDAVVGAAACVTRDVAARTTVVGVPARPRG
jgi:sugar O-acyltransferase (sialic acid O-acetyltransferase NeuD family)